MIDNSIITKSEVSSQGQSLKNKFFNSKNNTDNTSFIPSQHHHIPVSKEKTESILSNELPTKNQLLGQTKNCLKDLQLYDSLFKKQEKPKSEGTTIQKILLPIYNQINELKEEIKKVNEYTQIKKNQKIQQKSMNKTDVNDLYNLHIKFQQSKNNINDTMDYVNGNINNISYQDVEIVKALDDLRDTFEAMSKEMENIENDFNEKFEFIIKERRRQQIANDLLNGTYKTKNDYAKKLLNTDDFGDSSLQLLDKVDYNEYKRDITDINFEKDLLLSKYTNEKDKFSSHLPKLVNPKEKVAFSYTLDDSENSKNNFDGKKSSGNLRKVRNNTSSQLNESSNENMNTNFQSNQNFNSQTASSTNLKKNTNKPISSNDNLIIYEKVEEEKNDNDFGGETNNIKKREMSPAEKMYLYQKNMNDLSCFIETTKPKPPPERKKILIGPSKQDIIRGIQPRSSKTKKTLQTFQKKRQPPLYYYEQYPIKRKGFKDGKYPPQKENLLNVPKRKPKDGEINLDDYKVHYPYDIPEDEMKKITEKLIELYIKDALKNKGQGGPGRDRTRIDIINEGNGRGKGGYNDELLKLLIKKFGDLEDAIKGNWNRGNGGGGNGDLSDDIANQLYNKMKNDMTININLEGFGRGGTGPIYGPEGEQQQQDNLRRSRDQRSKINLTHQSYSINKSNESELGKDAKPIPLFENDTKLSIKELDKMILMPHKINLNEYEISNTSSYISESHKIKQEELNIQIQSEKKINESNSLSRGQVTSEYENDEIESEINVKNRTGLDLLVLKNFNENLPHHIIDNNNNNVSQIEQVEEYDEMSSSFGNSFNNNAREVVDINNNARLKLLQLYESKEYNEFKNNFFNNLNKTSSNNVISSQPPVLYSFGNVPNNNNNITNTGSWVAPNNQKEEVENLIKRQNMLSQKIKSLTKESNRTISEHSEKRSGLNQQFSEESNQIRNDNLSEGEIQSDSVPKSYRTDESSGLA